MTAKEIIVPVTEPTEWVSALAIATKKSGELRVCVDPRSLNKALRREHYKPPTLDDVLPELSKARIITTVDLRQGYWHVRLDEDSLRRTTFATPHGRYRWLRLPYGQRGDSRSRREAGETATAMPRRRYTPQRRQTEVTATLSYISRTHRIKRRFEG